MATHSSFLAWRLSRDGGAWWAAVYGVAHSRTQLKQLSSSSSNRQKSSLTKMCCCLVTKLCPTLCDPMDCSPPGSSVHRISQVRILEWVAISFSRDTPNPGIEPAYFLYLLHWQAGFFLLLLLVVVVFTAKPLGNPMKI